MTDARELPLSGVRIVDLTIAVSGPACTAVLGDLGAEVIKVENISSRLPRARAGRAHSQGTNDRAAYHRTPAGEIQRNKKSISLNLTRPEAREAFLDLVRVSDVVIDNYSPRVMPNFGFTYENLCKVKPDIIMVSMPAFGSSGPYRDRVSYGPGIDADSGIQFLSGYGDGVPIKPGHVFSDYNTAMFAAFSVMMALYHRSQTGEGQQIDVAMREAAAFMTGEFLLDTAMNHRLPRQRGNRHSSIAPHNVYPCREPDTWVAIAVASDAEWRNLRYAMDEPTWAEDKKFDGVLGRWQNQDELDGHIAQWTQLSDRYELMHRLQSAGVDAGAVLSAKDIAEDPHYRHRRIARSLRGPEGDEILVGRPGFLLSKAPFESRLGPDFAEHNDDVFLGLLGYSAEKVQGMEAVKATSRVPVPLE